MYTLECDEAMTYGKSNESLSQTSLTSRHERHSGEKLDELIRYLRNSPDHSVLAHGGDSIGSSLATAV